MSDKVKRRYRVDGKRLSDNCRRTYRMSDNVLNCINTCVELTGLSESEIVRQFLEEIVRQIESGILDYEELLKGGVIR
jgi:hypothetical protein